MNFKNLRNLRICGPRAGGASTARVILLDQKKIEIKGESTQ